MAECECPECRDCGEKTQYCSCSSGHTGYQFGSTKVAPWANREDNPIDWDLPTIADCDHDSIDPVQSVADFYLLDAIKNAVRFSEVEGASDALSMAQAELIRSDSMLSGLTYRAGQDYRRLVERLAPQFLAYAISAVGGDSTPPPSRDKAWDKFVKVVQKKGPEVLFDADTLFREFGGGSYGGEKWGNAAKVVGKYLDGSMPDWLFVDRVFTLQHNGGCFLNKVNWRKSNRRKWGLSHMLSVLNAHAGIDAHGNKTSET